MKKKDVVIGHTYVIRVSGQLTRVKIEGWCEPSPLGRRQERWHGININTGREIRGTAARLRGEAATPCKKYWCPNCNDHRWHGMSTEERGQCITCRQINYAPTGDLG